jgi:release factor glutamine methyltransferase
MQILEAIRESGIPPNESRILLAYILNKPWEYLLMNGDKILPIKEYELFCSYVHRRKNHEPISYITGRKEFYSRDFLVDSSVLIPRPDSELMIDVLLHQNKDIRSILELGIGSGCLLLTMLLEMPNAIGEGVDISNNSIKIAKQNMDQFELQNRCKIYQSNWFKEVEGSFDIIISNPPYINKDDQNIMAKETILFEPELALYAEKKGLAAYCEIATEAKRYLNENGKICLEIGIGQKEEVVRIFEEQGFTLKFAHKDLGGIDRILCFK